MLVFGAYGGRLDHVFANVNTITIARELTSIPIYLVDDHQQAFLLSAVSGNLDTRVISCANLTLIISNVRH